MSNFAAFAEEFERPSHGYRMSDLVAHSDGLHPHKSRAAEGMVAQLVAHGVRTGLAAAAAAAAAGGAAEGRGQGHGLEEPAHSPREPRSKPTPGAAPRRRGSSWGEMPPPMAPQPNRSGALCFDFDESAWDILARNGMDRAANRRAAARIKVLRAMRRPQAATHRLRSPAGLCRAAV